MLLAYCNVRLMILWVDTSQFLALTNEKPTPFAIYLSGILHMDSRHGFFFSIPIMALVPENRLNLAK